MPTFPIAALTEEDIPQVLALYRTSILPVWLAHGRDHDFGRIEANIRRRMVSADCWMAVARGGGELIGYLSWERHPDHTSTHTVAHLRMILVHPDQQGGGLGQALMGHFEAAARAAGCTKVLFDVVVGSPARSFYERLGYHHWSDYLEKTLEPS
jgi:GNAT superfamily N-acetyltransferase